MTTFQRLRALVKVWRDADKTLPSDVTGSTRAGMILAAYACAEDLQEVIDESRDTLSVSEAGRKGGKVRSMAKTVAAQENARQPRPNRRKKAAE